MPKKKTHSDQLHTLREGNLARLLLRAARDFSALAGGKLLARGYTNLRMGHATLLANLDPKGSRITTLAQRAGMTKQGMSQLVKELEGIGYLERSADPLDRRAVLVRPTLAGQQLLRDVQEVVSEIEIQYSLVLGEEKIKSLRVALLELNESQAKDCDDVSQHLCADA
jgi:DNA-binding MarR family transcriptional regulator